MFTAPPAFRHRDFRLFWSGLACSAIGGQFSTVAMAWQVYQLTGSPFQIGLLGLSRAIPQMALSLVGGLFADAIDRRKLLAVSQITQGSTAVVLVWLSVTDAITPTALFIATGLSAIFTALETPARQAILPNLVPREDLTSAMALNVSQRNLGTIVGPSVAGVVIAFSGATWCYALDGLSRLILLGAIAAIKIPHSVSRQQSGLGLGALRDGLTFVWLNPILLTFMLLDFGATLFGSARALIPIYAEEILLVGPVGMGMLYAAESIGAILAGVLMSTLALPRRAGVGVIAGVAIYGAATIVFAFSTWFWLSIVMLACAGVGNTVSTVLRGTINQLTTPDDLRGRVTGINSVFTTGGPALGQFESGVVAAIWTTEISALSGGVATLVLAATVAAFPFVRNFELVRGSNPSPGPRAPA
ncbi:MAG: MFS transporter [Chloroflexota bacterium]